MSHNGHVTLSIVDVIYLTRLLGSHVIFTTILLGAVACFAGSTTAEKNLKKFQPIIHLLREVKEFFCGPGVSPWFETTHFSERSTHSPPHSTLQAMN